MLGLWNAGLWALRLVLNIIDSLLTPRPERRMGPARSLIAPRSGSRARSSLVMLMIQLGLAVDSPQRQILAVVLLGPGPVPGGVGGLDRVRCRRRGTPAEA